MDDIDLIEARCIKRKSERISYICCAVKDCMFGAKLALSNYVLAKRGLSAT